MSKSTRPDNICCGKKLFPNSKGIKATYHCVPHRQCKECAEKYRPQIRPQTKPEQFDVEGNSDGSNHTLKMDKTADEFLQRNERLRKKYRTKWEIKGSNIWWDKLIDDSMKEALDAVEKEVDRKSEKYLKLKEWNNFDVGHQEELEELKQTISIWKEKLK